MWLFEHGVPWGKSDGNATEKRPSVLYSLIGDKPIGGQSIAFVGDEECVCKKVLICWNSVSVLGRILAKDKVCWEFGS